MTVPYNDPFSRRPPLAYQITHIAPRVRSNTTGTGQFLTRPASWLKLISAVLVLGLGLAGVVKVMTQAKSTPPAVATIQTPSNQPAAPAVPTQPVASVATTDVSTIGGGGTTNPPAEPAQSAVPPPNYHQDKPDPGMVKAEGIANPSSDEQAILALTDGQQLVAKGIELTQTNNLNLARKAFRRATELEPYWRDAWYLLGYALAQGDSADYTAARAALQKATTIDPLSKDSWTLLAKVCDFMNDINGAADARAHLAQIQ